MKPVIAFAADLLYKSHRLSDQRIHFENSDIKQFNLKQQKPGRALPASGLFFFWYMRKKAEKKIREAVQKIGSREFHRLDEVRHNAGLHPRIFDKTILDMERVGTIQLFTEGIEAVRLEARKALVRQGDVLYVSFKFIDGTETAELPPLLESLEPLKRNKAATIETVVVILENLLPGEWEQFSKKCEQQEGRKPFQKIEEMIRQYLYLHR